MFLPRYKNRSLGKKSDEAKKNKEGKTENRKSN